MTNTAGDDIDSDDDARRKQAAQGAAARHATQAELDARLTCAQLQTAIAAAISADGDSNEVKRLTFLLGQKQIEEGVARQEKWRAEKMKERQEDRERLMRMEDMMLAVGGLGCPPLGLMANAAGVQVRVTVVTQGQRPREVPVATSLRGPVRRWWASQLQLSTSAAYCGHSSTWVLLESMRQLTVPTWSPPP